MNRDALVLLLSVLGLASGCTAPTPEAGLRLPGGGSRASAGIPVGKCEDVYGTDSPATTFCDGNWPIVYAVYESDPANELWTIYHSTDDSGFDDSASVAIELSYLCVNADAGLDTDSSTYQSVVAYDKSGTCTVGGVDYNQWSTYAGSYTLSPLSSSPNPLDTSTYDYIDATLGYLDEDGDGYSGLNEILFIDKTPADTTGDGQLEPNVETIPAIRSDPNRTCDGLSAGTTTSYYADGCDCADDPDEDVHGALPEDINPGAEELCDSPSNLEQIDNDCDGSFDEDGPDPSSGTTDAMITYYQDCDGDNDGNPSISEDACPLNLPLAPTTCTKNPNGPYVLNSDDCDDTSDLLNSKTDWYKDGDTDHCSPEDGTGERTNVCARPSINHYLESELTAAGGDVGCDCDDSDASRNYHLNEVCDASNTDEDCDGYADDADTISPTASGKTSYYADEDGDGIGSSTVVQYCDRPATGTATTSGDCDDSNEDVFGGATEIVGNGVDENCDGVDDCYVDGDCDGHLTDGTSAPLVTETATVLTCATSSAPTAAMSTITPGACLLDDDAYRDHSDDCDDSSASVHGAATDYWYDNLDSNCDSKNDCDFDGDTSPCSGSVCTSCRDDDYVVVTSCTAACPSSGGPYDCDDVNASIGPNSNEVCDSTGTDEDCDGDTDEPYTAGGTANIPCDDDATGLGYATYNVDGDGDGYIAAAAVSGSQACLCSYNTNNYSRSGCNGYWLNSECWAYQGSTEFDCNDDDLSQHPLELTDTFFELPNGRDDDCDGYLPLLELDLDGDTVLAWPGVNLGAIADVSEIVEAGDQITDCRDIVANESDATEEIKVMAVGCKPDATTPTDPEDCRDGSYFLGQRTIFNRSTSVRCAFETGFLVINMADHFGADEGDCAEDGVGDLCTTGREWYDASGTSATNSTSKIADCDDLCESRAPGQDETCDGADQDCDRVEFTDLDQDGVPNSMDDDESRDGYVNAAEVDVDQDDELTCDDGSRYLGTDQDLLVPGDCPDDEIPLATGDCSPLCSLVGSSDPRELGGRCDGIRESMCEASADDPDNDDDDDSHGTCGALPPGAAPNEEPEDDIYVLVYLDDARAVPMMLPREGALYYINKKNGEYAIWTGHDKALADELLEILTDRDADDYASLLDDLPGPDDFGLGPKADPLLKLCIDATLANGALLTESTPQGACAVVRVTLADLSDEAEGVDSDSVAENGADSAAGCPEEQCPAWQLDLRAMWSRARILEARRRVMEWECFRMWGTLGCGGETVPGVGAFQDASVPLIAAPAFNLDDPDSPASKLRDPDAVGYAEIGRYGLEEVSATTLAGCWSDVAGRGDRINVSETEQITGGDCPEGDGSSHRDNAEGPTDPVHLLKHYAWLYGDAPYEEYNCGDCFDDIDNDCDGATDLSDDACAACTSQLGGCGGGADDEEGCSVAGSKGQLGWMSLLAAGAVLAASRRRRGGS